MFKDGKHILRKKGRKKQGERKGLKAGKELVSTRVLILYLLQTNITINVNFTLIPVTR